MNYSSYRKGLQMLRKLTRGQLRSWAIGHVRNVQGGLCGICKQPLTFSVMGAKSDYVVDHDHNTGEIRGVLHRSCNAGEGKVAGAAGRWGAKTTQHGPMVAWLKGLLAYYEQPGTGCQYPGHKTDEERAEIARHKRNIQAATRRAAQKVKGQNGA